MEKFDYSALRPETLMIFLSLWETGSIAATARHLGKEQRSIRYAIEQMRTFFNDEIFASNRGALKPTAVAVKMRPVVLAIADTYQEFQAIRSVDQASIIDKHFRLAYVAPFSVVFNRFVHALHRLDHDIVISHETVTAVNREDCHARLEAGKIDCLIDVDQMGADKFRRVPLFSNDFLLAYSPDFDADTPLEDLLYEGRFIATGFDHVDSHMESLGAKVAVRGMLTDADAKRMVFNGPYYTLAPTYIAARWNERVAGRPNLHLLELKEFPIRFQLSAFFRRGADDQKSLTIKETLRDSISTFA